MSRIAKKPILIPKEVTVNVNGQKVNVKGPKGQLNYEVHELISVEQKEDGLYVDPRKLEKNSKPVNQGFVKALLGTIWVNISNAIAGVNKGWERKLILKGVGYRAQIQGKKVNLGLGFSHPVNFQIPEGITIETPTQTELVITGIDKQLVGQVAANIRAIRPVEPYKGKGVRYSDEVVILKETKKK
jgi:large subunit ribosomal protein L6